MDKKLFEELLDSVKEMDEIVSDKDLLDAIVETKKAFAKAKPPGHRSVTLTLEDLQSIYGIEEGNKVFKQIINNQEENK